MCLRGPDTPMFPASLSILSIPLATPDHPQLPEDFTPVRAAILSYAVSSTSLLFTQRIPFRLSKLNSSITSFKEASLV